MTPNPPPTDRLPFVIDACGQFPPEAVGVDFEPYARPSTPQLEALIAEEWGRQVALAKGTDRMLFNGELLRYVRHAIENGPAGDRFHLTVGPTCFRDFVGTNLYNRHRLDEFGWHRFANPIGTTATLLTRDGRICYGRRSTRVVYHAGHVHTFGGSLEAGDRKADGTIDAFASVARELTEELGLRTDETRGLVCVGLIRDKEIHQPELLFEARLGFSADEVRSRWQTAEAKDEHDEIVTLDNQPEAIVPFIRSCRPIAPVAVGALFIHGLLSWGREWFESAAAKI
ncbi:MAG TPA: hypothetical protein VJZ71_12520 [Phycisphaerae bacterium]|nr:hypothetical protein [Phycisphaerae bacterium]